MRKAIIWIGLGLAMMLSACATARDDRLDEAPAASRADLTQIPGLIREPLSVNVTLPDGSTAALEGMVTRPDRPGRFPLVLVNHGMATGWDYRKMQTPNSMSAPALYFAQRGFAAVAVVRPAYGRSGGFFQEDIGPCDARDFNVAATKMGGEILAILNVVRTQPWADPSHVLLFGHSGGGFAALAAAAAHPDGVVGVVSFAGGVGATLDGQFCQPDRLVAEMSDLGRGVTVPSLWIYAANDHFFSPQLAQRMVDGYRMGGAPVTFVAAAPYGDNGHLLYRTPAQWQGQVDAFLQRIGLPDRIDVALPPTPSPPSNDPKVAAFFKDYLDTPYYEKAFAVGLNGSAGYVTGRRTIQAAKQKALERCEARGSGCQIYAIGDQPYTGP